MASSCSSRLSRSVGPAIVRTIRPKTVLRTTFFRQWRGFSAASASDHEADGDIAEAEVSEPSAGQAEGELKHHEFQAETRQLLDIVSHAIYTDKEVFLRELISNASDALEKARYVQTAGDEVIEADTPLEIRITTDAANNTLTISDSGIGMSADEIQSNLGTIARSGSKAFLKSAQQDDSQKASNIIGQFGVGFYSAFMVSTNVEVFSQSSRPGEKAQYWQSKGTGSYEQSDASGVSRGAKIVIHLKDECKEFSDKFTVKRIIKKYSNFIDFPVVLDGERVNTMGAVWMSSANSVTDEQHTEFYRYLTNAFDEPLSTLHYTTDAPIQMNSLFYFPERHTEKYGMGRMEPGVNLYSRKVLIKAKCQEILPDWLRFVKGVVDSEDIPLHVSRENMQDSRLIQRISTAVTKRIIRHMNQMQKKDADKFDKFYAEYSAFLKEGICTDFQHQSDIAKLLRFESSRQEPGKLVSLDDYIGNMKPDQSDVYFLVAPSRSLAEASPYFEAFKRRGTEVLFMFNQIDEFVMTNLGEFNKRQLKSIESADVAKDDDDEDDKNHDDQDQDGSSALTKDQADQLADWIKTELSSKVSDVVSTRRLDSSPAIVVDHESAAVRRMMAMVEQGQAGQQQMAVPKQKLQINPKHAVIRGIFHQRETNPKLAKLAAEQVFDNALIAAGLLDDPRSILPRMNELLAQVLNSEKLE